MIDDFLPSRERRTPKVIEPLTKPVVEPLPTLDSADVEPEPPRQVAPAAAAHPETDAAAKPVPRFIKWSQELFPLTKKQQLIAGLLAVLLMFGGGFTFAKLRHTTKPVAADTIVHHTVKAAPKPTTVPSTLTGLPVDPGVNQRPVTAVMIENSLDARPQSGLDQAGVVFEALAEGGVTRFMAVFQDTQPDYVGPVRSARPYYVSWALGFDAGYAHVGGSPDGLADIKAWHVRDLDQFSNGASYQRIAARYAPHNVYTSLASLTQLEQGKGYTASKYTGFARKAEAPSKTPNATSIDLTFSGAYYNSHFDYDAASNSYKRSEGGAAHLEANAAGAQTQISPKVVVAMSVPMSQGALDASGAYYSNYNPLGSGPVTVFQDGVATPGTWSKASNEAPLTFLDAGGQPLKLNPGQTWIAAITTPSHLSFK